MKAIRVHQVGAADVMKLEDVELPPPGPNEARVRNEAIGVNFLDVYFRTGLYPAPGLPFTPGSEGAGIITAVGADLVGFKPGDRVAYASTQGSYAEARNVPVKDLVSLPENISFEIGAAALLKGLTAQYLLRQTFKVEAGQTILVHAAAGGVGQILVQWGKALGATVIATAGSPAKTDIAKALGADHVIDYATENFVEKVAEYTGGKKCDVVYDGVGKATFPASLDCIRPFGMFVSYGSASGPIDSFNLGLLGQKGSLTATRPTLFTYSADRKRLNAMAADLFDVIGAGTVKVEISEVAPLADAARIHKELETRKTTASIVLKP